MSDILSERSRILREKAEALRDLQKIKSRIAAARRDVATKRRFLPSNDYNRLETQRARLTERITALDAQLGDIRKLRHEDDFQRLYEAVEAWVVLDDAEIVDDEVYDDALDNIKAVMASIRPQSRGEGQ